MVDETLRRRFARIRRGGLILGLVAAVLAQAGAVANTERFFQAYLFAYLFWIGLSLGGLALMMLHFLAGGPWGFPLQRMLAAAARTLPLMALLFLPLLLGLDTLYDWTRPEVMQADEVLRQKMAYLNVPGFLLRAAFYFLVWLALSWGLTRLSYGVDESGDAAQARRAQRFSGPGLILYVLTVSFAAIDWAMSLEPHWYSSIYGLLFIGGQVVAGLSFAYLLLGRLHDRPPLDKLVRPHVVNDLRNLLLAALLSWAYFVFVQYLIIWSGNLPEEAIWFTRRTQGGWQWLVLLLAVFHFALPFTLLLLNRGRRRGRGLRGLLAIAALLLVMRLVDVYWLVMPAFSPQGLAPHWLDLATVLAMGGLWMAFFAWQLQQHRLVPVSHPKYIDLVERYETAKDAS